MQQSNNPVLSETTNSNNNLVDYSITYTNNTIYNYKKEEVKDNGLFTVNKMDYCLNYVLKFIVTFGDSCQITLGDLFEIFKEFEVYVSGSFLLACIAREQISTNFNDIDIYIIGKITQDEIFERINKYYNINAISKNLKTKESRTYDRNIFTYDSMSYMRTYLLDDKNIPCYLNFIQINEIDIKSYILTFDMDVAQNYLNKDSIVICVPKSIETKNICYNENTGYIGRRKKYVMREYTINGYTYYKSDAFKGNCLELKNEDLLSPDLLTDLRKLTHSILDNKKNIYSNMKIIKYIKSQYYITDRTRGCIFGGLYVITALIEKNNIK